MRINVFSSGSSGNCTLLVTETHSFLIDIGLTKKNIEYNLNNCGLTIGDINSVLITHEHEDHIKALPTLLKEQHLCFYMTKGTFLAIRNSYEKRGKEKLVDILDCRLASCSIILLNRLEDSIFYPDLIIDNVFISVLPAYHDAAECVGFMFLENNKKLVYLTDTGYVHYKLYDLIKNADCYVLESNHDPNILMHSSRPYPLKIRILSDHGHLSNQDSMVTLAKVIGENTRLVMHAHISQECNLTQILEMTRKKVFDDYKVNVQNITFVILAPYSSKEFDI